MNENETRRPDLSCGEIGDEQLDKASGGAGVPMTKHFMCRRCGKTTRMAPIRPGIYKCTECGCENACSN